MGVGERQYHEGFERQKEQEGAAAAAAAAARNMSAEGGSNCWKRASLSSSTHSCYRSARLVLVAVAFVVNKKTVQFLLMVYKREEEEACSTLEGSGKRCRCHDSDHFAINVHCELAAGRI